MYNGYRVKINGKIVKNDMIEKGSYSSVERNRVVDSWEDLDLVEHEYVLPNKKTEITFNLRTHNIQEHAEIVQYFMNMTTADVEYWSDVTMSYKSGVFKIETPQWAHETAFNDEIRYKATKIKLTER